MLTGATADVHEPDTEGYTALGWAAWEGRLGAARQLLAAGADASLAHSSVRTALHSAVERCDGSPERVEVLEFVLQEAARLGCLNSASNRC